MMILNFCYTQESEGGFTENGKNKIIENTTKKTVENHDNESDQEPDIEKEKALFRVEINKLINELFSEEELGKNTLSGTTSKLLKNSNMPKGQLKPHKVQTLKGYQSIIKCLLIR